jgi:hypothetical protein
MARGGLKETKKALERMEKRYAKCDRFVLKLAKLLVTVEDEQRREMILKLVTACRNGYPKLETVSFDWLFSFIHFFALDPTTEFSGIKYSLFNTL